MNGRALVVALLASLALLHALPAAAHTVGLSRGLYAVTTSGVALEIVFARGEVKAAVPAIDQDGDGLVSDAEAQDPAIGAALVQGIVVARAGVVCPGSTQGSELTEEDGLAARLVFACAGAGPTNIELATLLSTLSSGHRHLGHVVVDGGDEHPVERDFIAVAGASDYDLDVAVAAPVGDYFVIGLEHILLGFDHLLFLFALLLVGGSLRSLLGVITAFTVAHSMTLALTVLGVVTLPGFVVEPAIALSIAYVGVENTILLRSPAFGLPAGFVVKDAPKRWRITFAFGLIHGFGFGGALAEIGVPADAVPLTLFLFNLGVEAGQLLVAAVAVPVLMLSRKKNLLGPRATRVLSAVVVVVGLFWFIERVVEFAGRP